MSDQATAEVIAEYEKRISLTEQAVLSIKATNEGITTKLDLLLSLMTNVALLEEKHSNQQRDVSRAHDEIQRVDEALDSLSQETRAFINYVKGVTTVLYGLSGIVGMLLIKVLFFSAAHGLTP